MKSFLKSLLPFFIIAFSSNSSFAYTISNIAATYHDGQVFITWTCPVAANLKYNVYRSTTKFTDVSQLNSATYMGNVRDSSCKNFRLSQELGKKLYFRIDNNGSVISASQGMYVFTCLDNQAWYYAVTVTKLSTGVEMKTIKNGKTALKKPIAETVADPQPIKQDSVVWNNGDHVTYYAWFVNNKDAPNFPAMCSQGSYGFNFYLIKRGNATTYPLFAFYEGLLENSIKGNGVDSFQNVTNCYVLGFDDWIPTPNGNGIGENTFWSGYHEKYDMYKANNAIPASGVVKMYTQKRYIQTILWARKYLPADTNKVFVIGISAGGFGAYLTANLIPDKITYAYCIVGDFKVISIDNNDTQPEQMWGDTLSNLASDVQDPETQDTIHVYNLFDTGQMLHINRNQSMPLFQCVYGKNDITIPWTPLTIELIDSIQSNHIGGVFFWDQRGHDGAGKNFNDEETMPDWYSFSNNVVYPAFSDCTIDQDPGNGIPSNGASLGALNGYLDYTKEDIIDQNCQVEFNLRVKDLYVGGVLYPQQFTSCFAGVTVRRAQNFTPVTGQKIKWKNFNSENVKIQNGSFIYHGGLITIPGVQINKSGCRLNIMIAGCNREIAEEEIIAQVAVDILQSGSGYTLSITSPIDDEAEVLIFDLAGKFLFGKSIEIESGVTQFPLPVLPPGISIVTIRGSDFSTGKKLFMQ